MSLVAIAKAMGMVLIFSGLLVALTGHAMSQGASVIAAPAKRDLSQASQADGAVLGTKNSTRSVPFCVLRGFKRGLGWLQVFNYTTTRVGTCSVQSVESLTAASASAQMATLDAFDSVTVQGPYYHTMDVNKTQVDKPYISLGDLRFSEVGRSEFTLIDALRDPGKAVRLLDGDATYHALRTTGSLNFIWFAGTEIYVLTSDQGERFIMTGVTHTIAFGQNGIRLKNLAQYLNLPQGWSFDALRLTRVLSLNSSILAGHKIYRLGDEFGNIYLRLPATADWSQMTEPM